MSIIFGIAGLNAGQYTLTADGELLLLNGQPVRIIGLRCSNALISDRTAEDLISYLDLYKSYGVNTVSVYFQGSRFGDVKGYRQDGSLDPVYARRMGRMIEAADERGMIVLVGCLYWGNSKGKWENWTQQNANRAIANTVRWLSANNYRNVFVDVDNEGMARKAKGFDNRQMVQAGKAVDPAVLIATNFKGDPPPEADLAIHHSNPAPGKPYIQSEASPQNAPGGYWGRYSKEQGYYNYINIGVYTDSMKQDIFRQTREHLDNGQGYMLASTWLQCVAPYGPNAHPGGDGTPQKPGVQWWLDFVREKYGPWTAPAPLSTVGKWDRFEIEVTNDKAYADPFRDVALNVTFITPPGAKIGFWGFYDGGQKWKIRFMPDLIGDWSYSASFSDGTPAVSGKFRCVQSDLPGPVTSYAQNPIWFGLKDGKAVLLKSFHVGDRFFADSSNSVTGEHWCDAQRNEFLDWFGRQGYNTLSIASFLLNRQTAGRGQGWNTPDLWNSDSNRPCPQEYGRMENILDQLGKPKIICYPFAGFFGQSADWPTNPDDQELYLRYTIARLAPYWNLLFNVAGPEPLLRSKWSNFQNAMKLENLRRLGARIDQLDTFNHLVSVHQPTRFSATGDPLRDEDWYTFSTLQGPKTLNRRELYQKVLAYRHPQKPLYAQETLWAGNIHHPDYSVDDIRKNAIVMIMAGASINFADNSGNSSSGFSGSLDLGDRNQKKHDEIHKVWRFFESIPWYKLTPAPELVDNGYCLADPGNYYLIYLEKPGIVNVVLKPGLYEKVWINASNPNDRRAIGSAGSGKALSAPPGGNDWFLLLKNIG